MFTHLSQAVVLSLGALLLLLSHSHAATYFMSPGASDSNPCTQSQPCGTFDRALPLMAGGDTLYMLGGDYGDRANKLGNVYPFNIPSPPSGSQGNPTIVAGYPGHTVQWTGGLSGIGALSDWHDMLFENLRIIGPISGIFTDNNTTRLTFRNILVDSQMQPDFGHTGPMGIQGGGSFHQFSDMELRNAYGYGIYWWGNNSIFDRMYVHDNCGYGVHIFYSGDDIQVDNNTFRNGVVVNNGLGIDGTPDCGTYGQDFGAFVMTSGTGNKAYNNVVSGNPGQGGIDIGSRCVQCEVYNNVVYASGGCGFRVANDWQGLRPGINQIVRNNVWYNNNTDACITAPSGFTYDHNWGSSQGNPQFANAGAGNFTLQATSPLRNAGVAISVSSMPSIDKAGVSRPQGAQWDIGAYEFVEGGTPPPSGNPIHVSSAASAQADCVIPESAGTPTSLTHGLSCMSVPGKELRLTGIFDAVIDTLLTPITGGTSWPTATKITSYGGGATLRLPNNTSLEAILNLRGANDSYLIFENLTLDGLSRAFGDCILLQGPGHHIRFATLTVQNCRNHALFSFGGQDVEVLGGTWTNSLGAPLIGTYQTNNWRIEGVTLHTSSSHAINMGEGFGTDNNVLINKVVICCVTGSGIRLAGGSGNTIRNSLISAVGGIGIEVFSGNAGAKIHYNTVVSNTGVGVQCDSGVNTAAIRANLVVGNTAGQFVNTCGATGGSNMVTGVLTTLFTNPAGGDYSLASGSPAQNSVLTADDLPEVTDDIIGTMRPQQVIRDAGAYESLLGVPEPPPTPPVNTSAALFFF